MSLFGVKKSAKNRAMTYERLAEDIAERQKDVDFGRELLSNIRQQRIASAQLAYSTQSDIATTTTAAGAQANLNSALAGDMKYSYETSARQQQYQNYVEAAEDAWGEYAKSLKKKSALGSAVTAITTGIGALGGPLGAAIGAAIGAGLTSAMGGNHVAMSASLKSGITGVLTAGASSFASGAGAGAITEGGAKGIATYTDAAGNTMIANTASTTSAAETLAGSSSWWTTGNASTAFKVAATSWSAGNNYMRGSW